MVAQRHLDGGRAGPAAPEQVDPLHLVAVVAGGDGAVHVLRLGVGPGGGVGGHQQGLRRGEVLRRGPPGRAPALAVDVVQHGGPPALGDPRLLPLGEVPGEGRRRLRGGSEPPLTGRAVTLRPVGMATPGGAPRVCPKQIQAWSAAPRADQCPTTL